MLHVSSQFSYLVVTSEGCGQPKLVHIEHRGIESIVIELYCGLACCTSIPSSATDLAFSIHTQNASATVLGTR